MEKNSKKGFTLTELVVVLVILAIVAAVAIPFAMKYIKLAEFRENEANAKTIYLAAESELTWYRTSGKWKDFRKEVVREGKRNDTFDDSRKDKLKGRIYAITLGNNESGEANRGSGELVHQLLEDNSYDKDFLDASITIEIDIETGQVYSAFYATRCDSLAYDGDDDEILNITAAGDNRSYDNRRDRLLGYYSVEDVTNVVELKPVRLKVTAINLVNSETLSLNWSSNSRHDNRDVEFHITFYKKVGDKAKGEKLFSTVIDRSELSKKGFGKAGNTMVHLKLLGQEDAATGKNKDLGEWAFPLTYQETGQNGRFSLVLDAMMSAELMESLKAETPDSLSVGDDGLALLREYSTSITRYAGLSKAGSEIPELAQLARPQDICAEIEVQPTYQNMEQDAREYHASSPVTSNVENTLFASTERASGGSLEAKLTRFRHLSNIRYCDEEAIFRLDSRNMDWTAAGTGLFDLAETTAMEGETPDGRSVKTIRWKPVKSTDDSLALDFPSIEMLNKGQTLAGGGAGTLLSNIKLGAASMPGDDVIGKIYKNSSQEKPYTEYLGIFSEVEGSISGLTLKNPVLHLDDTGENAGNFQNLSGVGILCGRSQGSLNDITVQWTRKEAKTVEVLLADRQENGMAGVGNGEKPCGIGGIVGVLAKKEDDGTLSALAGSGASSIPQINGLTMNGSVTGRLPKPKPVSGGANVEEQASRYPYGIGGIFGYASIGKNVKAEGCENHADVTGNLFTGGIGGHLDGNYQSPASSGAADLIDSSNDGLVLCSSKTNLPQEIEGRYFGGILGYGNNSWIETSYSASGRLDSERYDISKREEMLLGQYVGGIIGYGNSSQIVGCSTKKGGYILGSDYVGGIAGGFSNDLRHAIKGNDSITVTTNAGYVIGNNYVGGIVGKNEGEQGAVSTILNCVNQGVAAGYGRYIGGIVGYNGQYGVLEDCASYLSDYDQSVYRMVVNTWKADTGDCVGGMAGYNDGKINFSDSGSVTVKSVASLVVGRHFVGGMIGFNDIHGNLGEDLNENYTLIGGRIQGFGKAVGGCIGLNASAGVLKNELEVKPTSVTGAYYVGGCIGANVVDMVDHTTEYVQSESDIQMNGFRTDNRLGSITGDAFVGGVIGYHRTYTQGQLGGISIHDYLLATVSGADGAGNLSSVLPEINEDGFGKNLPSNVLESDNPYRLTVSMNGGTNNNVPIKSWLYTGGVVGYCEKNSRLILKNCKNAGNITKASGPDSGLSDGVSLKAYLTYEGMANAASELERDERVSMVGGIISANQENQIIDYCTNSGSMNGFIGLGGIVSFNSGGIFNCELSDNFGNAGLDYIGGIAGLNVRADSAAVSSYTDVNGRIWRDYTSGTIANCSTRSGRTIAGNSYVGGIVGYNMLGGVVKDNHSRANITAAGNYAGGIAGYNGGRIQAAEDTFTGSRSVIGTGGEGIGGIAGVNKKEVEVLSLSAWAADEVVAVNSKVTVTGGSKVGGIVGINAGSIRSVSPDGKNSGYLVCEAGRVYALNGYAGGIAGEAQGDIRRARNRSTEVTAGRGPAGGIVAVNQAGVRLEECENQGSVKSDQGYAGGIAAENYGTITGCFVGYSGVNQKTAALTSRGTKEIGAVCAINHENAEIQNSTLYDNVILEGEAQTAGGIAGVNRGTIGHLPTGNEVEEITSIPQIELSSGNLTIGGVAGRNEAGGNISGIKVQGVKFEGFYNYGYLGGIAGENQQGAVVKNCIYSNGVMKEAADSTAAGNCYGGIIGDNYGILENCKVEDFTFSITGIYTATSTSSAKEKEALSSHVGGIAGKNGSSGEVRGCVIGGKSNTIDTGSGMAGGIVGYNGGSIELSGDEAATGLMLTGDGRVGSVQELADAAKAGNISADSRYVEWNGINNVSIETLKYTGTQNNVNSGRKLSLIMSTNGNVGGITAFNTGAIDYCATGNWYLNNKSNAIGVGTGGIIGMNESGHDLSFLLNQAFVGRELRVGVTDRFAGGIIGNQNNTTLSGWKLENCINYGTIYCLRTHYSGGILGQWTGTGGTIENCQNYGNLQTTYQQGWLGAAGGIVAQLYHAYEENEYNIISCKNFGNIYGRTGKNNANCANDSAGILGNITAYKTGNAQNGQRYTIQVLDCVNGPGVEVYSSSMASGIVGFFSCSNEPNYNSIVSSTGNISLRIERCRNYASVLNGVQFVGGIFGERYGTTGSQNTILRDCYSVDIAGYNKPYYPIISYVNGNNQNNAGQIQAAENYYLDGRNGSNSYLFNNGRTNTVPDISKVSGNLPRVETNVLYYIKKDGRQYYAYLEKGKSLSVNNLKLQEDGSIYNGRQLVGRILFEIDGAADGTQYDGINKVVGAGSNFDTHVRNSFYIKETGGNLTQMPKPEKVELRIDESKLHIQVTPAAGTDPFQYVGALYRVNEDGSETLVKDRIEFFSEEFDVDLTEQEIRKGSTLRIRLRAYSMDSRILPSEEVIGDVAFGRHLPEPKIRIELTKQANGTDNYQYRFKLVNAEDYSQENDYRIAVKFMDQPAAVMTRPDSEGYLIPEGNGQLTSAQELQQLLIQAVSGNAEVLDSNMVPIPAYMPRYQPSIALFEQNQRSRVTCTVSGESVTDLGITVTLDTSASGNVTTPPVYRAELVGTWGEGNGGKEKNAVLASQDMLTAPNGKAVANFQLPEYIFGAKDLRVRVWYAQSGLGPVYTYRTVQEKDANIYTIKSAEAQNIDGAQMYIPEWGYEYSSVLDENDNRYFAEYRWTSGKLFDWITPPPHLMEETELTPEYDGEHQLQYTFRWDKGDGEYQNGNRYVVSLAGISGENKVSIMTGQEMTENEMTKTAEDWTYDFVELTVTRKGDASGTSPSIGLTSTKRYQVKQRLKRPEQPSVVNTNPDELFYTAEWEPIKTDGVRDETGCVAYGIYLRCYEEKDGVLTPGEPVLLNPDDPVLVDGGVEVYRKELNLEQYAGQRVLIYIVAQAAQDSMQYVNSVEGITYDLTIPQRIHEPKVTWEMGWKYDRTSPVSVEEFQAEDELKEGRLTVKITPEPDSIPTGDSSYLFKGYVFESKEMAEASKADIEAGRVTGVPGLLATYPTADGEKLTPVAMEADSNNTYGGTIRGLSAQHAGKWLLLYTRISSGNGQVSSKWTSSEIVRLPYVRLNQPEVTVDNQEREITLEAGSNPDLLGTETWNSSRIALHWQNVEWADSYYITLKPRTFNPDTDRVETSDEQTYRIVEETDENNERVAVYRKTIVFDEQQGKDVEYWERVDAEENQPLVFALEDYWAKDENGVYTEAEIPYAYKVTLGTYLEVEWDEQIGLKYTLILPDAESLTTLNGTELSDIGLKITERVLLSSDVAVNTPDGVSQSEAYTNSGDFEVLF